MKKLCTILLLFIILCPLKIYAVTNTGNADTDTLKAEIEILKQQNVELSKRLDSLSKDEIIKSLVERENRAYQTTDDTIKKINSLTSISVIVITVMVGIGTIGVPIIMFVFERSKFKKLEDDFNELKKTKDEYIKIKEDMDKTIKKFEEVQISIKSVTDDVAATEELIETQTTDIEKRFSEIKNNLDNIRIQHKKEMEEIRVQVQASAKNAKESETNSKASEYFNMALKEKSIDEKIEFYKKALSINPNFESAIHNMGVAYTEKARAIQDINREQAIEYCIMALEHYDKVISMRSKRKSDTFDLGRSIYNRSLTKFTLGDITGEKKYFESSIKDQFEAINYNYHHNEVYNEIAMNYRCLGDLEKAKKYALQAIESDNKYGFAYTTLAEICSELNDDDGFYENIELGLINKCPVWEFENKDRAYDKYKNTEKYKQLIEKYKN